MGSRGWEHVTPTDIAQMQQRAVIVPKKPGKYRNQVTFIGDKKFDSKKEAEQWLILQTRECAGEITGLKRQVPYALFVGVLAAWAVRHSRAGAFLRSNVWFMRLALVEFGLLAVVMLRRAPAHNSVVAREFGYTLIAGGCVCLLLLTLYDPWVSRLFRFRPLMALGAISYGVYVIHPVANWLSHWWLRGDLPEVSSWREAAVMAFAFGATLLLASASYRFFERPLVRLGHRWRY